VGMARSRWIMRHCSFQNGPAFAISCTQAKVAVRAAASGRTFL
jgi:hypothetical protein